MTVGLSVATMYGNVQNVVWLPWQPFKSRTLISWGLFVTTTRRNTELLVHNHIVRPGQSRDPFGAAINIRNSLLEFPISYTATIVGFVSYCKALPLWNFIQNWHAHRKSCIETSMYLCLDSYRSVSPVRDRIWDHHCRCLYMSSMRARIMGPTWGPAGADRPQMGPMLAPWTLLSRIALDK